MGNALYFRRSKHSDAIIQEIIQQYSLRLDCSDKNHRIYSDDCTQLTIDKHYVSFYFYNSNSKSQCDIRNRILHGAG